VEEAVFFFVRFLPVLSTTL